MPTLDSCINSIFEPGFIPASSGSAVTTVIQTRAGAASVSIVSSAVAHSTGSTAGIAAVSIDASGIGSSIASAAGSAAVSIDAASGTAPADDSDELLTLLI